MPSLLPVTFSIRAVVHCERIPEQKALVLLTYLQLPCEAQIISGGAGVSMFMKWPVAVLAVKGYTET